MIHLVSEPSMVLLISEPNLMTYLVCEQSMHGPAGFQNLIALPG